MGGPIVEDLELVGKRGSGFEGKSKGIRSGRSVGGAICGKKEREGLFLRGEGVRSNSGRTKEREILGSWFEEVGRGYQKKGQEGVCVGGPRFGFRRSSDLGRWSTEGGGIEKDQKKSKRAEGGTASVGKKTKTQGNLWFNPFINLIKKMT